MSTIIQFFTINGATIVLAVAIALLITSIWTWSRYRLVSAFMSLVGAVLLSGVWYLGFAESRVDELRAQLRAEREQTAELREEVTLEQARKEAALEDLQSTMRVHADQLGRLYRRTERVAHQLEPGIRLNAASDVDWSDKAEATRESNNRRYSATRREIEKLEKKIEQLQTRYESALNRQRVAEVKVDDSADLKEEIKQLRRKLAYGLKTDDYEVEVLPDNEVVRGQKGRYYVIDLKNAESGLKFRFPGGQYTLARSDAAFRKALNKFVGDVAGKLESNVRYGFFVRGSADSVPFRGRLLDDYKYEEVKYLKSVGAGRYQLGSTTRPINASIRNQDLPFLRARFLKDVVATTYPVTEPVVLEGTITDRKNNEDRNVELILYVDW